jgi:hypothetical protein
MDLERERERKLKSIWLAKNSLRKAAAAAAAAENKLKK